MINTISRRDDEHSFYSYIANPESSNEGGYYDLRNPSPYLFSKPEEPLPGNKKEVVEAEIHSPNENFAYNIYDTVPKEDEYNFYDMVPSASSDTAL